MGGDDRGQRAGLGVAIGPFDQILNFDDKILRLWSSRHGQSIVASWRGILGLNLDLHIVHSLLVHSVALHCFIQTQLKLSDLLPLSLQL
jgi:hypothetical protein